MPSVIRGSGESTLGGALDVQGVLTYEDVTSVDSIGIITARSGINVGTGASIFSPDTNELTLGTNNEERLHISSGGVVGINKTSPSSEAQLDVVGSSYWPILVKTTSTGGGGVAIKDKDDVTSLYTGSGGSSWLTGSAITDGLIRSQNNLLFAAGGNNERLRISSDGQMILGTASNLGSVPPKFTIVGNTNSNTFSECQLLRLNGPSGVGERGGIGFHYAQSSDYGEKPSSFIGVETVSAGGAQQTDLLFATRSNTNDVEPTERLRITSDGRILVGIKTARAGVFNTNLITPFFQMESAGQVDHNRMMTLVSNPGASGGYEPIFIFGKSRGTSAGDFNAVGNNDGLGAISWHGADGTELVEAARISAAVDGAVNTANDMPGRLDFWVTKDGQSGVVNPTMRIHNTGYMNVGGYILSDSINRLNGIDSPQGTHIATVSGYQSSGGSTQDTALFYSVDASGGANAGAAAIKVQRNSQTLRSINCGGTVNTSGNDYAEYMVKAGDFTIAKGDICGVNAQGKLTNVFANAVTFVVKSTDPSYVGGDTWDNAAGEEPGGYDDTRTGEELEAAKVAFKEQLEVVRQTVDRIAFCGQTPVNVTGTTPGQYIIPTANSDGSISGTAKSEGDLTLAEYMSSVGKVIAIEEDGRAKIIVKVS